MPDNNNYGNTLEQELVRRLEKFDRRFDRNGWFFLVILIAIFFITLYLFMQIFRVPEIDTHTSSNEILSQIESLEERIESYEIRLDELEAE